MAKPKAYNPQNGYKYQILCRNTKYNREFEHCDYAKDKKEKGYLIAEYSMAYQSDPGWEFKSILLPRRYWTNAVQ